MLNQAICTLLSTQRNVISDMIAVRFITNNSPTESIGEGGTLTVSYSDRIVVSTICSVQYNVLTNLIYHK